MIYLSYVFGTALENLKLEMLSRDEVKKRMMYAAKHRIPIRKVNATNVKPLYDEFKQNILQTYNQPVELHYDDDAQQFQETALA